MKMTKKQMRVDTIRAGEYQEEEEGVVLESQSSCVGHTGAALNF